METDNLQVCSRDAICAIIYMEKIEKRIVVRIICEILGRLLQKRHHQATELQAEKTEEETISRVPPLCVVVD